MNKEELKPIDVSKYTVTESGNVIKGEEKETTKEDFFRQNFSEYCVGDTFLRPYWDLFETGYELKQNILSQHILELQNDKGNLTDKVRDLETQNEEIENYFVESAGYGRDKVRNFMDIVDKALEQKGERITELEEAKANLEYLLEGRDNEIDELKKENKNLAQNLEDTEICENGWKNRVKELEAQVENMKVCQNCDNWNWKHNKCEKKLKGDCFKHSKWVMRNF